MSKHKIELASYGDPGSVAFGVVQWEGVDPDELRDKLTVALTEWIRDTEGGKDA